jgi:beta-galactosidase
MAEKMKTFVESGGTLVMTYWSALVDESDLCFLGGFPGGGLREVFGIWDEEMDSVLPFDTNSITFAPGNALGLAGTFETMQLHSLIHAEGAHVAATYDRDFYAGRPAVTVNHFGKGRAIYLAARTGCDFLRALYGRLMETLALPRALDADLPEGVTATKRTDGERDFVFLTNFATTPRKVELGTQAFTDLLTGARVAGTTDLPPYGVMVLTNPG